MLFGFPARVFVIRTMTYCRGKIEDQIITNSSNLSQSNIAMENGPLINDLPI
jgi:hypothetical protein